MSEPLSFFAPAVRDWFVRAFGEPTPPQAEGWPAIAAGESTLISAPTGSGKTLAAFLWAIDRLIRERPAEKQTRVVYVSPLKALGYDVERNLRVPLTGIAGADAITVGIRTGDTPQKERQALLRRPPEILITTPESLYLMLTSRARETIGEVESVIVDEIHAVAGSKRGSHLALTLERLEALTGKRLQRIGLSATQRPIEEIARFLGGVERPVQIVEAASDKQLDVGVVVPVADLRDPETDPDAEKNYADSASRAGGSAQLPGDSASRRSIWPSIYPRVLELVQEHSSTIVFVNNRRLAERLALRLNDLAEEEVARSHHGSLSREARSEIEEELKAGRLRCLVATSSLELGIDMGAVDLVIQIESPKSVSRGLQRIGRAGHTLAAVSKGRIFPKFRADLVECAVVVKRMRERAIEATVIPRNPLDVLAQQIVAIVAVEDWTVADLHALVTRAYPYRDLSRTQLENVLDMLDGRYPSEEFAELRPRLAWDRIEGVLRARRGSQRLAVTNAGTIPDRGLYGVHLPDGRRVGELDEEMVYEARTGQTFRLGSTTWRIEEITRDRVIVTPAPEVPGAIPFWHGDGIGRPYELGAAIGAFQREISEMPESRAVEVLERDHGLDRWAAENLYRYLGEQRDATRVVPSDRTIVVERFRDEIGDWRLCVLTPFGGRVHAAWAMAISARMRNEGGLDPDAIWSDDGVILHLPDADEAPGAELALLAPDEVEELVTGELSSTALFGSRFREAAGRALLIPRRSPGRRTPLWQQRLKAQGLLQVARRYGEFPIVLETFRECLKDYLDLPALVMLLERLDRREITLVEADTPVASPFAQSLLFDYIASYMYEGDTPRAEQRAAALALDRDLLRELLGAEELRELIDPDALASVEEDLQCLRASRHAADADQAHDLLRILGDLSDAELGARLVPGLVVERLTGKLTSERRAAKVRIAGAPRWIAAQDAGLYRDALGAVPPGGLPAEFLETVDGALERLLRRYARTHGPFTTAEATARYGVAEAAVAKALEALERRDELVRGELRPNGHEREWCDPEVLRRLRRATLAALRDEIEPADQAALARFALSWHGIDRYAHGGEKGEGERMPLGDGADRLREVLVPLQGLALAPEVWERDVMPRRLGRYDPAWLDALSAAGELVWVGAGSGAGRGGRVALYFRDDARFLGPPPGATGDGPRGMAHDALRERLARGAAFWSDLVADLEVAPADLRDALWDLVWAGEVTNDAFAPLRARRLSLAPPPPPGSRPGRRRFGRRAGAQPQVQGRWSLAAALFEPGPGVSISEKERAGARAELLLERHGIVTRETVLAERLPGGFAGLYAELAALETVGAARRGYFVEGLGGAQFALAAAVERLRSRRDGGDGAVVLAAQDPANPYGAALPWPKREDSTRRPARVPGAYVVLLDGAAVLYLEAGGRGLVPLVGPEEETMRPALEALAAFVRTGPVRRVAIERFDGEPVVGSPVEGLLADVGFRPGPRKLILSA